MSYKKKEHGGERQPSTMQMKRLPCRVLLVNQANNPACSQGLLLGSLCEVPYSPVHKVVSYLHVVSLTARHYHRAQFPKLSSLNPDGGTNPLGWGESHEHKDTETTKC